MATDYFDVAARAARRTSRQPHLTGKPETPIGKVLEAQWLVELAAHTILVARKLLDNGTIPDAELLSLLAWADGAHDWLRSSGFSPFTRQSARSKIERLIEWDLSGLQLVPHAPTPDPQRIAEADTERSEVDRLAPLDPRD